MEGPSGPGAKHASPARTYASMNWGQIGPIIEIVARTVFLIESVIIYNNLAALFHAKYNR